MPAPQPAPVLTGVPVSGMAYLDRPKPAGYFIFPDLSVRHEGKYRLRFSLYEESKDRDEMVQPAREGEPREFAAHRIEVKSKPFTVFSAKKFPGLAESTALSRIVAEQGCRVRIRRDVRMRRRSDRPGRDGESEIDETAQLRAQRRAATPDDYDHDMRGHGHHQPQQHPHAHPHQPPHGHHMQRSGSVDRKRSGSDASVASVAEVPAPPRFDDRYAPRQEHNAYNVPPSVPQSSHHHLSFGASNTIHHPAPPPNVHPPQVYNAHAVQPRYPPNPPVSQHPQQSPRLSSAPRPQSIQSSQYAPAPSPYHRDNSANGGLQVRRASTSQEYQGPVRRESDAYRPPHGASYRPSTPSVPTQSAPYSMDSYNNHPPYSQSQSTQYHPSVPSSTGTSLPPLKLPPLAIEPKVWEGRSLNSPATSGPTAVPPNAYPPPPPPPPPPQTTPHHYQPQYSNYPPPPPPPQAYIPVQPTSKPVARPPPTDGVPRGTKREYGRVFNDTHLAEPLHNGKRPDTISENSGYGEDPAVDDEDDFDIGKLKMTYRRACGEEIVRRLPLEE